MAATILIVEDEYAVARGIQYALQQEGYQVAVSRSGGEGLEFALREGPDLVLLDVRLPDMDGFEVLRRLRTSGSKAPVLVLTARDEEMDKVIGLELGADDYMTKPFGLRELMSRIKALLRRAYGDLADAAAAGCCATGTCSSTWSAVACSAGSGGSRSRRRSSRFSATWPAGPVGSSRGASCSS